MNSMVTLYLSFLLLLCGGALGRAFESDFETSIHKRDTEINLEDDLDYNTALQGGLRFKRQDVFGLFGTLLKGLNTVEQDVRAFTLQIRELVLDWYNTTSSTVLNYVKQTLSRKRREIGEDRLLDLVESYLVGGERYKRDVDQGFYTIIVTKIAAIERDVTDFLDKLIDHALKWFKELSEIVLKYLDKALSRKRPDLIENMDSKQSIQKRSIYTPIEGIERIFITIFYYTAATLMSQIPI